MIKQFYFCLAILVLVVGLGGCASQSSEASTLTNNPEVQMEDPFDPDRPPTPKTLYVMADILSTQGRDRESEMILRRVLEESPDFFPAYNSLAEVQMRNRRIPEAIKTLSAGLEIKPDNPVLLNNLGMCWLIRREYARALEYFTQAAGVRPENTRYRSNMATSLVLLGRRDEALALYEQILPKEEALENIQILCNSIKTPSE